MSEPLNPDLYRRLQSRFGEVEIASPGMALIWSRDVIATFDGTRRQLIQGGEEYHVNCPRCRDTRKRLYVNHHWGAWDKETDSDNLWLIHCYNEGCFDNYGSWKQLYDSLHLMQPRAAARQIREGSTQPTTIEEQAPPGPVIPIDELAERDPSHPAVQFLYRRGFDCGQIGRVYRVGYCSQSKYGLASNRLIIPVYHHGKYVGWQARYIGEPQRGTPKYWTCPGMAKRQLAYNFDRAIQHQTIVIVEGPTDVWNFGPHAMALFGKSMHPFLLRRLFLSTERRGGRQSIVILLDPVQDPKDAADNKPHHIDALHMKLGTAGLFNDRVLAVRLPDEHDPGTANRRFMYDLIRRTSREQNFQHPIDFRGPAACR